MAYHQGRLVAIVSHQSVRAVYHHTFRCVSKCFRNDDIQRLAPLMISTALPWWYAIPCRIDYIQCFALISTKYVLQFCWKGSDIMPKNYLIIYSEQLATDIALLCQNIKAPSNSIFQIQKVQAVFTQIFVKQIMVKVRQICFLNSK